MKYRVKKIDNGAMQPAGYQILEAPSDNIIAISFKEEFATMVCDALNGIPSPKIVTINLENIFTAGMEQKAIQTEVKKFIERVITNIEEAAR